MTKIANDDLTRPGTGGVTKQRTARTALKYGAASCGEEYTHGNDRSCGFNLNKQETY